MTNRIRLNAVVLALLLGILSGGVLGCNQKGAAQVPAKNAAESTNTPSSKSLTSRDQPLNAAPLGVEIGFANVQGLKEKVGSVTSLKEKGINSYSGGTMFESNGEGLGVEGLSNVLFIFDKNSVLAGVIMTLPKGAKDTFATLSKKYQTVDNKIDNFMNYGYARLSKGESLIEIDSPHLSFTMEVRYLTKQLMTDFNQQSAEQEARKKQEKSDKM